jgi:NAD+ kinase
MTRSVLVVAHLRHPEAVSGTELAVATLGKVGMHAVMEDELTPGMDLEAVLVLGGDGTLLHAAELARGTGAPIVGVNFGHVGFLAETEREQVDAVVHRIAARDYDVEERGTVGVTVHRPGMPPVTDWALNEAAVEKADRTRMVSVAVEVDGRPLSSFGCDGVVMSTATGSTAHAFSAGGPVVWPDVDAMVLVPISAHALFARPIVVGPSSVLAVEVVRRSTSAAVLCCDGHRRIDLPIGSRVEVRRGAERVRLARLSPAPFTDRLVSRFSLPVAGWKGWAEPGSTT